jgi:hypothetical protein
MRERLGFVVVVGKDASHSCQREETNMATLTEIRDAMMEDLQCQGMSSEEVLQFKDQFDNNAHLRTDLLVTTDVEMSRLYAYVDQQLDGSYLSVMRIEQHREIRQRFL